MKIVIISIIMINILAVYLAFMYFDLGGVNYQSPVVVSAAPYVPYATCPMNTGWRPAITTVQRLEITQVKEKLESYVESLGYNYAVSEIMEFSNNFYAVIKEKDTNIGAFELLVDPYTGAIMPEPGPNMMWNTKYGMHFRMMGRFSPIFDKMIISEEEAKQIALRYLSQSFQGKIGLEEPTRFYGYYTIDYTVDGKIHGMLSVNGFSGDVWYHSWHGYFIQEIEIEENE